MGSGCKSTSIGKFCPDPVSSNCVKYEGDSIPILGICTGDTITEVEQVIINKLLDITSGTGIVLSSVTLDNCQYLKTIFAGKDKTLANLLQLLIDSECNLKSLIDQINAKLEPTGNNFIFDLKCVTVTANPIKTEDVLQGTINVLCALKTQVDNIASNQNNTQIINDTAGNLLKNAIVGCTGINVTGSGASVKIELSGMVPPYVALPYFGPTSYFDGDGKGLPNTQYCKFRLCNGKGGTPDMRGVVPIGAIQGVQGGALNPIVDPTGDASLNYAMGQIAGRNKATLNTNNIPAHVHPVNDPGHSHVATVFYWTDRVQGGSGGTISTTNVDGRTATITVSSSTTGITVGANVTTTQPISLVQPVMPCYFIMLIP